MQRSNSSRILLAAAGVVLLILGLALAWTMIFRSPATPEAKTPASSTQEPAAEMAVPKPNDNSELQEVTASERIKPPQTPGVVKAVSRFPAAASAQLAAEPRALATPYTRELLAGLTNLDLTRGPITQEQAQQWKQTMQALTAQGAAAVPAIREFLDMNYEENFGASGAGLLGQTSLRSAFINALAQIGGPEATAALAQTLQASTLPSEIAQLAQVLDQQAPGQYRQQTVSAVNEVLGMASKGQLPSDWDVGTLFKVLETYGDASTASTLQQMQGSWRYYATMTMAGLQNGEGVPGLIHEVQDASPGGRQDFALQMLAQVAAQYPDAGAALVQQASSGQIPDGAWSRIVMGLAGDQYQLGQPPGTGPNGEIPPGVKTYHIGVGNQNFYSTPLASDAQVQQRLSLIEQLLGATSNPAAVSALQSARATLNGMTAQ
jgi:hypothetical protein